MRSTLVSILVKKSNTIKYDRWPRLRSPEPQAKLSRIVEKKNSRRLVSGEVVSIILTGLEGIHMAMLMVCPPRIR
jgi:hypothetical protein